MQDGAALTLTANRQKLWDYQANNSRKKKYIFLKSQRRSTCTAALTLTANRNKLWDYQEKKINPKIVTRNRGGVDAHGYLTEVVGIAGKKISIFNKNNLNIPLIWALYFICATALTFESFSVSGGGAADGESDVFFPETYVFSGSGSADVKRAQCQRNGFFLRNIYIHIWQRSRGQKKGSMPEKWFFSEKYIYTYLAAEPRTKKGLNAREMVFF